MTDVIAGAGLGVVAWLIVLLAAVVVDWIATRILRAQGRD
jgi:hypothetical protein